MNCPVKNIWLVTREYAGIAEAGGVKNVACSLAEGLVRQKREVTVFIPHYGFVTNDHTFLFSGYVQVAKKRYYIKFSLAKVHGVEIILIGSVLFTQKHSVYVYTEEEVIKIPGAIRGKGHIDGDIMNMILQKAVLYFSRKTCSVPDVLHCQDAHTAILPALIRTDPLYLQVFSDTSIVVTIHNAGPGYRQVIPDFSRAVLLTGLAESVLKKAVFNGNVEPFLLAAEYGILTTVSPWYAMELTSHRFDHFTEGLSGEFERRGIKIIGITNGIDFKKYQAQDISCSLLPFPFDPVKGDLDGKYRCRKAFLAYIASFTNTPALTCFGSLEDVPHAVYFSYHGRIAWQKGLDVLEKSAKIVLDTVPQARFIIHGQGDTVLESILVSLAKEYPGRFVFLCGYERSLARLAVAVTDFLVLPSMFEPCGLEDFIGQIFGTLPVAHAVGGLQKIIHGESGFLYSSELYGNDVDNLARLLIDIASPIVSSDLPGCSGVPSYLGMIRYASAIHVRDTYNWDSIIMHHYIPLYEKRRYRLPSPHP